MAINGKYVDCSVTPLFIKIKQAMSKALSRNQNCLRNDSMRNFTQKMKRVFSFVAILL